MFKFGRLELYKGPCVTMTRRGDNRANGGFEDYLDEGACHTAGGLSRTDGPHWTPVGDSGCTEDALLDQVKAIITGQGRKSTTQPRWLVFACPFAWQGGVS